MRVSTGKITSFIIACVCLAIICSAATAGNVALGKTASANSVYSVYGPEGALDGDWDTQWSSTHHSSPTDPLWMKVDLGAVYNVDRIVLVGPRSSYVGYTVVYNLLVSTDDAHWTNLRHGTIVDTVDCVHTIYASGRSTRYVKFEGVGGSHWTGLFELEVYPVSSGTASVSLTNPTATYSQSHSADLSVHYAVDGATTGGNGWAVARNEQTFAEAETAVFETAGNVGSSKGAALTFRLYQNYGYGHVIGRFRLSITTANRSRFADGLPTGGNIGPAAIWTVLTPSECLSANGQTMSVLPDGSILAGGTLPDTDVCTITARTGITGITGVRLEMLKDQSLPYGGPGRGWNGNPVLTEITLDATPLDMRTVHAACRSLAEPLMAETRQDFRFTVMGQLTVLDGDNLLISDGAGSPLRVVVPGHSGLSTGQFAKATGSCIATGGVPTLVCSRDEVIRIQ